MTENAFFPAFVTACFAIALTLERPTLVRQGSRAGRDRDHVAVRPQALVLIAIYVAALVLKLGLDLRAPTSSTQSATPVSVVGALRTDGARWSGYRAVATFSISRCEGRASSRHLARMAGWSRSSTTSTSRLTGSSITSPSWRLGRADPAQCADRPPRRGPPRSRHDQAERALFAVTVPAVVLVVIEVGIYASRFSLRIEERNMFCRRAAPLPGFRPLALRGAAAARRAHRRRGPRRRSRSSWLSTSRACSRSASSPTRSGSSRCCANWAWTEGVETVSCSCWRGAPRWPLVCAPPRRAASVILPTGSCAFSSPSGFRSASSRRSVTIRGQRSRADGLRQTQAGSTRRSARTPEPFVFDTPDPYGGGPDHVADRVLEQERRPDLCSGIPRPGPR